MGKKKDKKGKGAEKTQLKELKNSEKRLKKELSQLGEDAIENIISQHDGKNSGIKKAVETKCSPPSRRCNMTLTAHPEKDLLIMFGGEFFNGKETTLYNDLFMYHIKTMEWSQVITPKSPVPRCSHQAVAFAQAGGQLWIFGGEYVNPSQTQFFHFNDLWVYHFTEKNWEKIEAPGGPSPRSGHRMVACRKTIFIFGGFCDNSVSYKYFNDLHAFDVESRVWLKLQISGLSPSPRSGCVMAVTQNQCNILVYGGYSKEKVKKDVDKGDIHKDMFMLSISGSKTNSDADTQALAWKWSTIKQYGQVPTPRCSQSLVVTSSNRAIMFGGVKDEDEDEENIEGCCLNDMHLLEIDKGRWHPLALRQPNENVTKKRRRGNKADPTESDSENDDIDLMKLDVSVKRQRVLEDTAGPSTEHQPESDVFKVTVSSAKPHQAESDAQISESSSFEPSPRMRPMLAAKRGLLYLYGGTYEEGNRQMTLSDFYSIDLQKMSSWNIIIPQDETPMDWQDSDDSSDGSDDEDSDSSSEDSEESESDADDDDEEDPTRSGPRKISNENFKEYFERTFKTWEKRALKVAEKEGITATAKQVQKAASRMAQEYWDKINF